MNFNISIKDTEKPHPSWFKIPVVENAGRNWHKIIPETISAVIEPSIVTLIW